MTIRRLTLALATLALLIFCAQPALAHCGKCGKDGKDESSMEHMQAKCNCQDCSRKDDCDCGCAKRKDGMHDCKCSKDGKHDCKCSKDGMHDCKCSKDGEHDCKCGMKEHHHDKLKCADCEKKGHHGHHNMREHGDDDGKLDELFEQDQGK